MYIYLTTVNLSIIILSCSSSYTAKQLVLFYAYSRTGVQHNIWYDRCPLQTTKFTIQNTNSHLRENVTAVLLIISSFTFDITVYSGIDLSSSIWIGKIIEGCKVGRTQCSINKIFSSNSLTNITIYYKPCLIVFKKIEINVTIVILKKKKQGV